MTENAPILDALDCPKLKKNDSFQRFLHNLHFRKKSVQELQKEPKINLKGRPNGRKTD